jgi:purine-binding chemotaxis protein CheW
MARRKREASRATGRLPDPRLPDSGLAEDILRQLEEPAAAAELAAPAAPPAADREPPAPGLPPAPAGAERLFAFVDRLHGRAAPAAAERREEPETWVTFELAGEEFALPVTHVEEVLRIGSITRVPHAPAPVRGITNLRGRVLAVIDLRVRLGLEAAPLAPQNRIVVVSSRDRSIGLLVDAARQVAKLLPSRVQPPPADVMTDRSDFILGVYHLGDGLLILLDVNQVLAIQGDPEPAS